MDQIPGFQRNILVSVPPAAMHRQPTAINRLAINLYVHELLAGLATVQRYCSRTLGRKMLKNIFSGWYYMKNDDH